MSDAAEAAAKELDWVTTRVLQALVGADRGGPADQAINGVALTFLLRQYLSTDRADLRDALGAALAQALEDAPAEPTVTGRAAWLTLFVEASAVADDERILAAIRGADRFLNGWHGRQTMRERLLEIAEATADDERPDGYGAGERIERLEARTWSIGLPSARPPSQVCATPAPGR